MSTRRALLLIVGITAIFVMGACGGMKPTASAGNGKATSGPVDGKAIYEKQCAVCHGATGGGGVGPAFSKASDSQLLTLFPNAQSQVEFVTKGSAAFPDGYGATKKRGTGAMPAFSSILKAEEIEAVVKYERQLAGE